jgi:hypothetical protein
MSANSKFYIPNCSFRSVVSGMGIHLAHSPMRSLEIQDGVKDGRQIL